MNERKDRSFKTRVVLVVEGGGRNWKTFAGGLLKYILLAKYESKAVCLERIGN